MSNHKIMGLNPLIDWEEKIKVFKYYVSLSYNSWGKSDTDFFIEIIDLDNSIKNDIIKEWKRLVSYSAKKTWLGLDLCYRDSQTKSLICSIENDEIRVFEEVG